MQARPQNLSTYVDDEDVVIVGEQPLQSQSSDSESPDLPYTESDSEDDTIAIVSEALTPQTDNEIDTFPQLVNAAQQNVEDNSRLTPASQDEEKKDAEDDKPCVDQPAQQFMISPAGYEAKSDDDVVSQLSLADEQEYGQDDYEACQLSEAQARCASLTKSNDSLQEKLQVRAGLLKNALTEIDQLKQTQKALIEHNQFLQRQKVEALKDLEKLLQKAAPEKPQNKVAQNPLVKAKQSFFGCLDAMRCVGGGRKPSDANNSNNKKQP